MNEMTTSRPWKTAALASAAGAATLAFGMFLAVAKDSVAGDQVKVYQSDSDGDGSVKVLRVVSGDDSSPEAQAAAEAAAELDAARGGYLGVAVSEDTKSSDAGAFVDNVVDGSPAEKAGLKDGDVIVAFGGDVIRGPAKLTEKIRATKPGDKVAMDVRRDGKPVKLQVEMGDRPKSALWAFKTGDGPLNEQQQMAIEDSLRGLDEKMPALKEKLGKLRIYGGPGTHRMMIFGDKPLLGVEMVETTPDLREAMGGAKDAGVLVGKVLAGTAAEKAGIKVGDLILSIDGDKVADSGDLGEAIRSREGKTVDIDLVRDKKPMHVKAALPKIDEQEDPPTGPRASAWRLPAAAFGRVAAFLAGLST